MTQRRPFKHPEPNALLDQELAAAARREWEDIEAKKRALKRASLEAGEQTRYLAYATLAPVAVPFAAEAAASTAAAHIGRAMASNIARSHVLEPGFRGAFIGYGMNAGLESAE